MRAVRQNVGSRSAGLTRRIPTRTRPFRRVLTLTLVFASAFASVVALGVSALADSFEQSSWPCVQRKVPEISAGTVWAGPPVDTIETSWRDDPTVAATAARLAARRLPVEDAEAELEAFAAAVDDDKAERLTLLFMALLDLTNQERREILAGLERLGRRQVDLAERIRTTARELQALRAAKPDPDATTGKERDARMQTLQEQLAWDTRVYDERRLTTAYVCESPVLLEQRIFALSKAIQSHLP